MIPTRNIQIYIYIYMCTDVVCVPAAAIMTIIYKIYYIHKYSERG